MDAASPPITTAASGRWTSAPELVAKLMGMNPRLATSAVVNTRRSRTSAPRSADSLAEKPRAAANRLKRRIAREGRIDRQLGGELAWERCAT